MARIKHIEIAGTDGGVLRFALIEDSQGNPIGLTGKPLAYGGLRGRSHGSMNKR